MKKKEKKVNSEEKKEKDEGIKMKWKTWMTVVTVIAGVLLVSGITVLGVFFAGGFDEKFIYPEAITYQYDEDLLNNESGYIEIDDDLTLMLNTETPEVTRTNVQLSFDSNVPLYRPSNGFISDGTIIVPEYVSIGSSFTVRRATTHITDKDGNTLDWIAGGLSRLWAKSENSEIESISIQIAVDVPVYQTETIIVNSKGEETSVIVKNESFTAKTKFYPANSQYMYSDDLNANIAEGDKRVKKSYFEQIDTNDILSIYDGNSEIHFVASDNKVNGIKINGYTFIKSQTQLEYEANTEDIGNSEYYYTNVLTYLSDNVDLSKMATATFNIDEENIGYFSVNKEGQTVSMKVDEGLNLYLNQYLYASNSDYLGVSVYSASGLLLDNLLNNIAVSFERAGRDPSIGMNKILTVTGAGEPIEIDGVTYYKPIVTGSDKRYSYWRLSATDSAEIRMRVVLLVNNDTELFKLSSSESPLYRDVNLNITKHEELPVTWLDQSELNLLLDYTNEGGVSSIQPKSLNLEQYASVPAGNIYQDKVFFISFGNGNIEDYIETANDIIGERGYIRERSGVYATNSGNLTLFAIDGARLTIYNTCEFTLYFATVREEPAQDGLYQIVQMSSGGKRVVCEKALYTDSVVDYDIASTEGSYPTVNNEISINQGNTNEFMFSFTVKPESVPVFTDEFQKGYMSPKILDRAGNDITEYFNFNEGTLADIVDSSSKSLVYAVTPKSSVMIDAEIGIYFGYFVLTYDNGDDEPIVWQFALRNEHIVNLYKPKAMVIDLAESDISKALLVEGNKIELEQSLTDSGEFKTTIRVRLVDGTTAVYESVNEFINKLIGTNGANISITDQKQRKDTLNGKWTFAVSDGNANIISFTPEGQSFSFKNTDSNEPVPLSLVIKSNDGNATLMINNNQEFKINFNVKSTGITKILYDSSSSTYVAAPTTQSLDISKVDITKNGAKGTADNYIVLNDIVKFYCQSSDGEVEYNRISFRFNPQFYSQSYLSDTQITDLFGLDGMLELYEGESKVTFGGSYTPDTIRSFLASISVTKIKINKNFASSLSIPFIVSDRSGAVNTAFNLSLTENLSISNETYNNVYAGAENKIDLENKVTNINAGGAPSSITTLYDSNKTYYIVLGSDGRYVLTNATIKPSGAVGELSQGQLNVQFYDFWDTSEKSFTVYFQPEGQNSYALNHPIIFTVKRDLIVNPVGGKFYVLGGNNEEISKFAKITRHDGETTINNLGLTYEFSDYIEFRDNSVQRKAGADFFFDYNQKSLFTTLTIKYGRIVFGEIEVEIQLVEAADIYSEIASKFYSTKDASIQAKTQIINNGNEDVEYLVIPFNADSIWETSEIGSGNYKIMPSQDDHDKNKKKDFYSYSTGETTFVKQNQLLAGINNTQSFIALRFGTSESDVIAFMHMPLVISSIGYDTVVYENGNVDENRRMETSILRPEQLIEKGIYNEIYAGQLTTIINEYVFDKNTNITKGGLYTLSGFSKYLRIYSLDEKYKNYSSLVKNINAVNGTITLNHLSSNVDENVFVALEFTLETSNGANRQDFYYLLKVIPDINVKDSIYAYNGSAEYITAEVDKENIIDFETLFGNNTLHNNEKRFMVNKIINLNLTDTTRASQNIYLTVKGTGSAVIAFTYNDKTIYKTFKPDNSSETNTFTEEINLNDSNDYFYGGINSTVGNIVEVSIVSGDATIIYEDVTMLSTLKYTNSIESVMVREKTFTNASQWNEYITFKFSNDYSKLSYIPKTNDKITVVVKHSYDSTSETSLSIEGADQYYTFIINEDEEIFAVKYTFAEGKIEEESANFTLTLDNGAKEEGQKIYDLDINLLRKEESGSMVGTIVPNRLQMSIIDGGEFIKKAKYETAWNEDDGVVLGSGKFRVQLLDYINSDKEVRFAAYTNVGLLSVFTLHLKANVTYMPSPKENANVIVGGSTQTLLQAVPFEGETEEKPEEVDEYPNFIRLDEGEDKNIPYIITSIRISGNGADFVKVNTMAKAGSTVYVNGEEIIDSEIVSLTVADLISNKEITIEYIVNVEMDSTKPVKDFHFSQNYILQQNIIPKSSVIATGETIAGEKREVIITSLYDTKEGAPKSENTSINVTTSSSNPAFSSINGNQITTGQVSEKGTLELRLQVNLVYGKVTQTFYVNYSFVVAPSVKLDVNYPMPNKNGEMDFEYVENKLIYPSIQTFVSSNPIFGEAPRFVVYKATDENKDGVVEYTTKYNNWQNEINNYSVIVNSQTNAYVAKGNEESSYVYAVNENIEFFSESKNNEKVPTQLCFLRQRESGSDAVVELGLTFNSVSIYYTVKVLTNALQMSLQTVSNFSSVGEYKNENSVNSTVNYETIYVDKTSTSNLFEGGRLVYAQLSETMSSFADDYYFVFAGHTKTLQNVTEENENGESVTVEKEVIDTKYYASYPIYISSGDQAKNIYYDLGISFNDGNINDGVKTTDPVTGNVTSYNIRENVTFEFYGLYLASSMELNKIKIDNNKHRQLVKNNENSEVAIDKDSLPRNLAKDVFRVLDNKPQVEKANRIQLTYGYDDNGNALLVDFKKYKSMIKKDGVDNDLSITNDIALNEIKKHQKKLLLPRSDGSNSEVEFSLNYYFAASIDISMDAAATMANNFIELEVEREEDSLVSLFGLKHPTNGRAVTASDFSSGNSSLDFEVLEYTNENNTSIDTNENNTSIDKKDKEIFDNYLVKNSISEFKKSINNYDYLYNATKINANGKSYDYSLTPLGAKNIGDFLLTRVVYKVGDFAKTYYVVLKIMPDYVVTYGGSVDNAAPEADGTIISNYNNIKTIASIDANGLYKSEDLTGLYGYLAISHKNTRDGELAVKNFDITLPVEDVIDAITFNKRANLHEKVFYRKTGSNDISHSRWIPMNGKNKVEFDDSNYNENLKNIEYYKYNNETNIAGETNEIKFAEVKEIFFGSQYYYFEGVDKFEYKYRVYFKFEATKRTPEIINSITISEDGLFDLGAQYQELSIGTSSTETETEAARLSINASSLKDPLSTNTDVQMIKFRGIEAWQYDADYKNQLPDKTGPYLKVKSDVKAENNVDYGKAVYEEFDSVTLINTGSYLQYPNINYMSIESIKLYNPDTNKYIADVKTYGGASRLDSVANAPYTPPSTDSDGKETEEATAKWLLATSEGHLFCNRSRPGYGLIDKEDKENPGEKVKDYHPNLWQIPKITDTNIFKGSTTAMVRMVVTLKFAGDGKTEYCDCPINITIVRKASIAQTGDSAVIDGKEIKLFDGNSSKIFNPTATGVTITGLLNDTLEVLAPKNRTTTFGISMIRKNKNDEVFKEVKQTSVTLQNGENYAKTFYVSLSQYFGENIEENDKILIECDNSEVKFFYISVNSDEKGSIEAIKENFSYINLNEIKTTINNKLIFDIRRINSDYVYVEDAKLLTANNYYGVTKYYVAICKYEDDILDNNYLYRVSANYTVTANVYKIEKLYTGSIGFSIEASEGIYEGPIASLKGEQKFAPLKQWRKATFRFKRAQAISGITESEITDINSIINYIIFEIAESSDSSDSRIGRAYIDSDGTIILGDEWRSDQYIKINIKVKVSGPDRMLGQVEDEEGNKVNYDKDATYLCFETLSIGEKK